MTVLRTLIVDDEPAAIEGLRLRLQGFTDIELVGEASSVEQALLLIDQLLPELIFLDIEMPGQSGFDLVRQLHYGPAIVFVTAFHQHAVQAFEVRALDYLLKPVTQERLADAIERVRGLAGADHKARLSLAAAPVAGEAVEPAESAFYKGERQKLVIQDGRNPIQLIPFQDILWIDAAGDYMCVHTPQETHVMRARLKSLIQERLPDCFVQIHKSTVVNLNYIDRLEPLNNTEFRLFLNTGKELKVSRTYAKELKQRLIG